MAKEKTEADYLAEQKWRAETVERLNAHLKEKHGLEVTDFLKVDHGYSDEEIRGIVRPALREIGVQQKDWKNLGCLPNAVIPFADRVTRQFTNALELH